MPEFVRQATEGRLTMKRWFGESTERRLEPHARELVTAVYRHLLHREPDEPGLQHWLTFLERGGTFDDLIAGFLRSAEYARGPGPDEATLKKQLAQMCRERGFEYGRRFGSGQGNVPPAAAVPGNPLGKYVDAHVEGPGIWKWWHYLDAYHRHFARFVGREVHLLEVGVFGGGSLDMWRTYFGDGCRIYGVDLIEECRKHERDGVRIFIGDQGDRAFWQRIREELPRIDIVIDDGSHIAEHQIVTLEEMLPHVRAGGMYACEDIYGSDNPFDDYVSALSRHLNEFGTSADRQVEKGLAANGIQRSVHSVHHYPYLTIIEKHADPVGQLAAPRRGSEWEFEAYQALSRRLGG
jgi:hypothetical protein